MGSPEFLASIDVPAALQLPSRADVLPYHVKIITGTCKGAGTDANIELNLVGSRGDSGWRKLLSNHNMFERGQVSLQSS